MFGLLRLIRGIFGFVAAWQVLGLLPILSWLQDLGAVNGNIDGNSCGEVIVHGYIIWCVFRS